MNLQDMDVASSLVDYYDSVGATPPNTINTMKKIAESIQMCNMYEFDSEFKRIKEKRLLITM